MDQLKKLFIMWGPICAFASSIWYLSSIFHSIDGRIDHLQDKINTILVQVQSTNDVRDARFEGRVEVLEERIKGCGCQEQYTSRKSR